MLSQGPRLVALIEQSFQTTRFKIDIFSSIGKEMGSIDWNNGRMLKVGWSIREELLCLQDDGYVLIYNIFGQFTGYFSMGKDASDAKVIDGKIFTSGSTGVIVLTPTKRFYLVTNIYDVKLEHLTDLPDRNVVPSSWLVINTDPVIVGKIRCSRMSSLKPSATFLQLMLFICSNAKNKVVKCLLMCLINLIII